MDVKIADINNHLFLPSFKKLRAETSWCELKYNFQVLKISEELQKFMDKAKALHSDLMNKHAEKNEDGTRKVGEDGQIVMVDGQAFMKELNELLLVEEDIPVQRLDYTKCIKSTLTTEELESLKFLFDY